MASKIDTAIARALRDLQGQEIQTDSRTTWVVEEVEEHLDDRMAGQHPVLFITLRNPNTGTTQLRRVVIHHDGVSFPPRDRENA